MSEPVRIGEPAVLLRGPALLDVKYLVDLGLQVVRQRDGIVPPARLVELRRLVAGVAAEYARMSRVGHGDVLAVSGAPSSVEVSVARRISTREVAEVLGISTRQVRRLRDQLGGSLAGSQLLYDADAVEAFAASRAAQREAS